MATDRTIAQRMFDGFYAKCELEDVLEETGVPEHRIGWDHYDCSLELYDMDPDFRLPAEALRALCAAGFMRVFVNHVDKWETHYTFKDGEPPEATKGWRVSYPHKRGSGEKGIWVEEVVPGWPDDWFKCGDAIVKAGPQGLPK